MPRLKIGNITHPEGPRRFIVKLPDTLVGTIVNLSDEWEHEEAGVAGDKPEYGVAAVEFMGSSALEMIVRVYDYSYQCTVPYPAPGDGRGTFLTLVFASPDPDPDPEPDPEPDPDPEPGPCPDEEFKEELLRLLEEIRVLLEKIVELEQAGE